MRLTFIAPSQHMTSGGAYVIAELARHCLPHAQVSLVVEEGEPQPVDGIAMLGARAIERRELPPADALLIPADDPQGELLCNLEPEAGLPVLLFQGYGTPGNPRTVANLKRARHAVVVATWLLAEAERHGCAAELVRPGFDRQIFLTGPPTTERRPSVAMMSSPIDWKGTWDGLAAIARVREELAELDATLIGHLDPELPQTTFLSVPDRPVIAATLREAMVFVCPSWEEGLGLPGIEAMLCGAALATTDTKGSRDYAVHGRTALVSPPQDPEALAANILRLIEDERLRSECVKRGRQLVDRRYPDWAQAGVALIDAVTRLQAVSYHRMAMESEREHAAPPLAPVEGPAPAPASPNGATYDFEIDVGSESTHARVIRLVGRDRRVLELGPATGYMSQVLVEHGCSVVGIEVDQETATRAEAHCERVIIGDLDELDLEAELGEERFDVILAADVLEHLKDPLRALRRLRPFLEENGFFVISLPNVAHGSVRLALLEGRFPYQPLGLLDQTHLRFFTRESIDELMDEAELAVIEVYRQQLDVTASEVPFDAHAVPPEVLEQIERDPEARTYQFVIKAVPLAVPGLRELQRRVRELAHENARLHEAEPGLRRLADSREAALRSALIDAHDQLLRRDQEMDKLGTEYQKAKGELAAERERSLRLQTRLDRILRSPPARAYEMLRGLPGVRHLVAKRQAAYEAALRSAKDTPAPPD